MSICNLKEKKLNYSLRNFNYHKKSLFSRFLIIPWSKILFPCLSLIFFRSVSVCSIPRYSPFLFVDMRDFSNLKFPVKPNSFSTFVRLTLNTISITLLPDVIWALRLLQKTNSLVRFIDFSSPRTLFYIFVQIIKEPFF